MILKKNQEELLNLIHSNVYSALYNDLNILSHNDRVSMNDLHYCIQAAISTGVQEGFRTLLENQYTDEEFEQDIGLKS